MPFVEVANFRFDTELGKQPPAADAENQFLLQTQFWFAAIQFAGDASMLGKIRRIVAIQQIELYATDLDLPPSQPDQITGQLNFQPQPFSIGFT